MKVSVKGRNKHLTKKEIRYILEIVCKATFSKKLYSNLVIDVQCMKLTDLGYCAPIDDSPRHRHFEILLNSAKKRDIQIATLVHEIAHVRQYASGDLMEYVNNDMKWKGKRVKRCFYDYHERPWEIEANHFENELTSIVIEKVNELSCDDG